MDYQAFNTPTVAYETIYATKGFTHGIDVDQVLRSNRILATAETSSSPVKSPSESKQNVQSVILARGAQHADAFLGVIHNYSTDGDGNTAFYGHAVSAPGSFWVAAIHGETRHAGGVSIAGNFEMSSYSVLGDMFGVVINNTTGNVSGEKHEITGAGYQKNFNTTAFYVTGSDYTEGLVLNANFTSGRAIDIKQGGIYIENKQVLGKQISGFKDITTPTVSAVEYNRLLAALRQHGIISE